MAGMQNSKVREHTEGKGKKGFLWQPECRERSLCHDTNTSHCRVKTRRHVTDVMKEVCAQNVCTAYV